MVKTLPISSLDYKQNKDEWIAYLQTKPEFSDSAFDGSNLSYLVSVQSDLTQELSFLANSAVNEAFIDTIQKRSSMNSKAMELSYDITRSIPAEATVKLQLTNLAQVLLKYPSFDPLINTLVLPRFSTFVSSDGSNFITLEDQVLSPANNYTLVMTIFQGVIVEDQLLGTSDGSVDQVYTLGILDLSSSLLDIKVDGVPYTNEQDITLYGPTDEFYQVFENYKETYDFKFGGNSTGIAPDTNSDITLTYMTTAGAEGNGKGNFTLISSLYVDGTITNANEIDNSAFTTTSLSISNFGTPKEDIEVIRKLVPRWYASQGRAISTSDYTVILLKNPIVETVNVYSSIQAGSVNAVIQKVGGGLLTSVEKDSIIAYMEPFTIEGTRMVINDPTYINIRLDISVNYSLRNTTTSAVLAEVNAAIANYFATIQATSSGFFYSNLICDINNISTVQNATMTTQTYSEVQPSVDDVYYFNLGQTITPSTVTLSFGTNSGWYDDGIENILDREDDTVIGSINYTTGVISIVDYTKLASVQNLFYTLTSGNVELFQNVLVRYDEAGSTVVANGN